MAHEPGLAQFEAGKSSRTHGVPLAYLAVYGDVMVHGRGLAHFEARVDCVLHWLTPFVAHGPGVVNFTVHGIIVAQFGANGSCIPQGSKLMGWVSQGMTHIDPQGLWHRGKLVRHGGATQSGWHWTGNDKCSPGAGSGDKKPESLGSSFEKIFLSFQIADSLRFQGLKSVPPGVQDINAMGVPEPLGRGEERPSHAGGFKPAILKTL